MTGETTGEALLPCSMEPEFSPLISFYNSHMFGNFWNFQGFYPTCWDTSRFGGRLQANFAENETITSFSQAC